MYVRPKDEPEKKKNPKDEPERENKKGRKASLRPKDEPEEEEEESV